jgi:signal transduction histidine kinase/CheY-like chemotaxis protein
MIDRIRKFFTWTVNPDALPTNHGATLVANTAFLTVGVIGAIVLMTALVLRDQNVVVLASTVGIIGAITGYLLWRNGHVVLATTLHAGGLVFAGTIAFLGMQTIGGPTGILFLASVITAGGFLGWKGAMVDVLVVFSCGLAVLFFGDVLRPMLGLSSEPFSLPEDLVQLFVFLSIPAWGAYVVAVDASNRQAWKSAYANKQRLEKVNVQLQQSQQQQAKVAELGLQALQDVPLKDIEESCRDVFVQVVPSAEGLWPKSKVLTDEEIQSLSLDVDIEYALFVDGLTQIISTRRLRESLIAERARLASELQKEQRMESLSRMAGGVAHDFNNALMVVTGIGDDLLMTSSLNDKSKKGIETILSVSRHISDMTTQLLLFAKGLPIKESLVDVNEIVQEMTAVLQQMVPTGVELTITLSETTAIVRLPPEQIERMVLNLVRNSSMAYEGRIEGRIHVTVCVDTVESAQLNDLAVCIQVKDDGVGMDEPTLERAIEPYFSIRGSTGLGLSTVHGLIEQAGGILEIASEVGKGSIVKLWMPATIDQNIKRTVRPLKHALRKGTILLIDDEPLVRSSVKVLLENLGWHVLGVSGREDACAIVAQDVKLDLVVCDVRLYEESGFDLINDLQKKGLSASVLYITGFATPSTETLAQNENLLVKPFLSQDLNQAIQRLLEQV